MFFDRINKITNECAVSPEELAAAFIRLGYETTNSIIKKCPPDYNPGFCYPDYDCNACRKEWLKENGNN